MPKSAEADSQPIPIPMPRSPKHNQRIRDARREEILVAATAVFLAKGFSRAKISEIAAAAGLSHGLVYHYFQSKDAVLDAIADRMMEHVAADMEVTGATATDRIVDWLTRSYRRLREDVDARRLILQVGMQGELPVATQEKLHGHFLRVHREVIRWIPPRATRRRHRRERSGGGARRRAGLRRPRDVDPSAG